MAVLVGLIAAGMSASPALARQAVRPPPVPPPVPPPAGTYVPSTTPTGGPGSARPAALPSAGGTFVPSTAAPGGPPANAPSIGTNAPPPPSYVRGGGGGYQVQNTTVVPSYGNYVQSPAGGALRGAADLTAAQGQYWNDIQNARITREQANQAGMDTRKKEIEFQMWYETVRPTAPKMVAKEKAADLDWARKYAQNTEIWSGSTLNVLYRSAIRSKYLFQGPNIPVDDTILRGLNLNDQTTRANGGLLKENKLFWTETLDSEPYDKNRDAFTKSWTLAQQQVAKDGTIDRGTLRELQASLKDLSEQLDAAVSNLPPSRYIESNRYIRQLKDGVKALENTRRGRPATYSLVGNARNVAEICGFMAKNGLQFSPATARDDFTAYSAFYLLLRSFEMSVSGVQ